MSHLAQDEIRTRANLERYFWFITHEHGQQDALSRIVSNLSAGRDLWDSVDCSRGGCTFDLTLNGQRVPMPPAERQSTPEPGSDGSAPVREPSTPASSQASSTP
jgi:hypothetical protein